MGAWTSENGTTIFKSDGTFDEMFRETVLDLKPGEVLDDPEKVKTVERDASIAGQYQWIEEDQILVLVQGRPSRRLKLVIEGDSLTILEADGKVSRLQRKK